MEQPPVSLVMTGGASMPGGLKASWPSARFTADSTGVQISLGRFASWHARVWVPTCDVIGGRVTWLVAWDELERAELGRHTLALYKSGGDGCAFGFFTRRRRMRLQSLFEAHGVRTEKPHGSLFFRSMRF